jgi:glycerol kinase
LGVKLRRPKYTESTSLGAVFAAGLGAGVWTDLEDIESTWKEERAFTPQFDTQAREEALARWHRAIGRVVQK